MSIYDIAQAAADYWHAVFTSDSALSAETSETYQTAARAYVAALRDAYGLTAREAQNVRSLTAQYGPHAHLDGTARPGVASLVEYLAAQRTRAIDAALAAYRANPVKRTASLPLAADGCTY